MILPGWETSSLGVKDASIKRKLDFCYGAATDCICFLPFPKIGHTSESNSHNSVNRLEFN